MTSFPGSVHSSLISTGNIETSERKRRDNINEKIQELLTIIPPDFFQDYYKKDGNGNDLENSTHNGLGSCNEREVRNGLNVSTTKPKGTGTKDGKPNKGQILTQAVEYLIYLQNQVDIKNREEVDLILKVKEVSKETGTILNDINLENTSAEIALAKIGVGPLAGFIDEPYGSEFDQTKQKNNNFEYGGYSEFDNGG